MSAHRSSRELSGRVEIEFHKRPNPIKRAAWWSAVAAILVSLAWLGYTTANGQTAIYQGGDISTAHAMFENDCAKCHSLSNDLLTGSNLTAANHTEGTWAPLRRLLNLNDEIHSVSNANCEICHTGTVHHKNQLPMHGDATNELSCATCHREHEGDISLAAIADSHCTRCHNDLVVHTNDGPPHFAEVISDFSDPEGHPDFRIEQLLAMDKSVSPATAADGKPIHHAHTVIDFMARDGEPARWQDTARIRFNHQAHLKGMFNEKGEVTPERLSLARRVPYTKTSWVELGGIKFNSQTWGTVLYGMTNGMQYKGLEKEGAVTKGALVESNCFYGVYGLMESVDQLVYDFDNIIDPSGEAKWFNLVLYNPMHIFNNTAVGYE